MRVQRAPADDFMVRDGETAVLAAGSLVRLTAIGTFIYRFCAEPTDVPTLTAALAAEFGQPSGGSVVDATNTALELMIANRVLVAVS